MFRMENHRMSLWLFATIVGLGMAVVTFTIGLVVLYAPSWSKGGKLNDIRHRLSLHRSGSSGNVHPSDDNLTDDNVQ